MSFVSPTPLANPLHFVLGNSAAGCVRAACDACGMPGAVIGFANDLAAGPLDDSQARDTGPRGFLGGGGEAAIEGHARVSHWRAVLGRLERERPDAVILWSGDNVAEVIFVAMACDRLAGRPELLLRVQVPGNDGRPWVATHLPDQLARLYATRRPLSAADRRVLAQDFARIRDTCGPVRRLESGRVVGVPGDYYDHLLLAACGPHWQAAGPVVGTAMAHCDGPNLMGDGFFSDRLGVLIDAGRIEASGPRTALREYRVRLAPDRQG